MSDRLSGSPNWGVLVVTVGLASAISAIGGFANEVANERHERWKQGCEIASQLLQDESPTPHLAVPANRKVVSMAARRAALCLTEWAS